MKNLITLFFMLVGTASRSADLEFPIAQSDAIYDGVRYESALMMSAAAKTVWNEANWPPPIAPKEAEKAVLRMLSSGDMKKLEKGGSRWMIHRTALVNLTGSEIWYYAIDAFPATPGTGGITCLTVYVAMDGRVSSPVRSTPK